MEVKDIIRNSRLELGYTMKEVADMVGVAEATISRWESGDIENMRRDKISALSKALHIPLEVLMGWGEKEDIKKKMAARDAEIRKLKAQKEEMLMIERVLRSKHKDRIFEYIRRTLELEDMEDKL